MTGLYRSRAASALILASVALLGCPPSEDASGSAPTNGDIVDPGSVDLVQIAAASVAARYPQCADGRCIELRFKAPICPNSLSPAQFDFALLYGLGRPLTAQVCGATSIEQVLVANSSSGAFLSATPAEVARRYRDCFGVRAGTPPAGAIKATDAPPGWYDTVILRLAPDVAGVPGVLGDGRDVAVLARLGTSTNCPQPRQPALRIVETADVRPSTNCPGGNGVPNPVCFSVRYRLDPPRPLDEGMVATFDVRREGGAPAPFLVSSTLREVTAGGLLIPSPPPPIGVMPAYRTRWFPPHGRMTGTFAQGEATLDRFGILIERAGRTSATVDDINTGSDIRVLGPTGSAFAISNATFNIVHESGSWPIGTHLGNVEILTDASLIATPNPFRFQLPPVTQTARGVAFDTQNGLDGAGAVTISFVRFGVDEVRLASPPTSFSLDGNVGDTVTRVEIRLRGNPAVLTSATVDPILNRFTLPSLTLEVLGSGQLAIQAHAYDAGGQYLGYDEIPLVGLDPDGDGIPSTEDNCPDVFNQDQMDYNNSTLAGAACETTGDLDGDGVSDPTERANGLDPWLSDTDGDGIKDGRESLSDARDPDTDGDGELDGADFDASGFPLDENRDGIQDSWDPDDLTKGIDSSDIWFVDQDWVVSLNNGNAAGEIESVTGLNATVRFTLHYLLAFGQNWLTTAEPALQAIPEDRTGTWARLLRADDVGVPFVTDISVQTESCDVTPDGEIPVTCQLVPIIRSGCTDEGFDTPDLAHNGARLRATPTGTQFFVPEYPSDGFVRCADHVDDPRFGRIAPSGGGLFAGGPDTDGMDHDGMSYAAGGYLAAPDFATPPTGITFAVCNVASTFDSSGSAVPGMIAPGDGCDPTEFPTNATFVTTELDGLRLDFLTAMTAGVPRAGARTATAHVTLSQIRSLLTGETSSLPGVSGPSHSERRARTDLSFSGMSFSSVTRQVTGTSFRPMRLRFVDGTAPRSAPGVSPPVGASSASGTDRLWNGRSGYRAHQTDVMFGRRTSNDWFRMHVRLEAPRAAYDRVEELLAGCEGVLTGRDGGGRPLDSLSRCATHLSIRVGNAVVPARSSGVNRCWGGAPGGYVEGASGSCSEAMPSNDDQVGVVLSQNVPFRLLVDASIPGGRGGVRVRWTGQPETIETINIVRDAFGASPSSVAEIYGCMRFGLGEDLMAGDHVNPLVTKGTVVPGAYRASVRGLHATADTSRPDEPNCSLNVLSPVRIDNAPVSDARNIWVTPAVAARDYGAFAEPWVAVAQRIRDPLVEPEIEIPSTVSAAEVGIARSSFHDELARHYADLGIPVEVYPAPIFSLGVGTTGHSYRTLPPFNLILMTRDDDARQCFGEEDARVAGRASRSGLKPPQSFARACAFLDRAWEEAFKISAECLVARSYATVSGTCHATDATSPIPRMAGTLADNLALGGRQMSFVAVHEVGHLLGLDHVGYPRVEVYTCGGGGTDCLSGGGIALGGGGGVGPGPFVHVMEGPLPACDGSWVGAPRDFYFVRRGLESILDPSFRTVTGSRAGMWAEPACAADDSRCSRGFFVACGGPAPAPRGVLPLARFPGTAYLRAQYGTSAP